jgi:hypothetical protein
MAITEYTTGVQPNTFTADDQYSKLQGTRDGAIWNADWVLARSQEGRVFVANAGSVTTPITFGAGDITEAEMDLFISVPSGTAIGILDVAINMEAWGTSLIFQCMAKTGTGGTVGAGTAVTPRNLRSDAPFTSNCTVTAAATVTSGVALTGPEFFRDGLMIVNSVTTADEIAATLKQRFTWNHKDAGYIPIVVGGTGTGCAVYASSQAGTGFITVTYVEIPSNRLT